MKYKTLSAGSVKAAAPDGTATVVIATTGRDGPIDHDGDIVQPGAIGEQVVPILPAHDWSSIWLGKAKTHESGNQVLADLKFNLGIPEAQAWHSALAFDLEHPPASAEYSWGYDADASRPGRVGDRTVRFLDRLKLHEVSMVVRGASVGTRTLAVKGDESDDRAELLAIRDKVRGWQAHEDFIRASARAEYERFRLSDALVSETRYSTTGERFLYRSCPAPPAVELLAAKLASVCASDLSIAPPDEIRFFSDADKGSPADFSWPERLDGLCDRETRRVWIRAGLSVGRLTEVVAHETRHLAPNGDEVTAAIYGRRFQTEGDRA